MSLARQPRFPAKPDGDVWVRTYAVRFTQGLNAPAHNHVWHQLSYASQGVLRVATDDAAWIVPPNRAVWIPAGVDHREEMRGEGTMRSLYLASGICRALPRSCAVVNVPPLLRELILTAAVNGALDARKPSEKHLAQVIVDQLALLEPAHAQQLAMPRDPRALAVATRLQKNPANDDDLAALGKRAGASKRTLQRLFLAETRMSFARWRQRMRLLAAVEHLGQGRSVTDAALDVGYQSVSAFVSSFRREFGVSPGKFAASS
jgi:AraC-like DNA-binding protein